MFSISTSKVRANEGFPVPDEAAHPVTAITCYLKTPSDDGIYYVMGCKDYTPKRPDVRYMKAEDEGALLTAFLNSGAPPTRMW